ncbi:aspartate 1-decarboxylase [Candidatus Latescibacterota bacterium]
MRRIMLKSKLHNAAVTQTELSYMGSITIDGLLLEQADILENERVQVVNINNGERFETYVISGEKGSGTICLNGPAARLAAIGDRIYILSYATMNEEELIKFKPDILILNEKNEVIDKK